ncbi:hypothetical protein [Mucilaginibacter glaciei]|uniref:Adhesin domain-containing protein n=1 Tax=Mucilaginibacter glaciei TaxID=2772109 RepID=A0A926NXG0_9SPHI|nr:hypothetical protein [Mucilaginibacter glaciei]MBD1393613.1 hypothetical protein [Mucilaginibacter glaciei]
METKIYKRLFAFIALLVVSAATFAQDTLPAPPLPPENYTLSKEYKLNKKFDSKTLKQFNFKMNSLNKHMLALSTKINTQVAVKMKGFDKKFKTEFKDFGKNFAGSFSDMVPDVDVNVNNNISRNLSDEDYKRQLASGEIIEKIKNYSKSYSVDGNDVLQISNKFGNVTVNTWNKNEFKVDVQMKFSSDNESNVNDMMEGSSVSDSKSGNVVSFRTAIGDANNGQGNKHQNMSIDYKIYMPASNAINISNQFGVITLPNLSGKTTIRLQFGNLIAQQLTNTQNDVSISFTSDKTSFIELFNGGKLKIQHSNFKAGVVNNADAVFGFSKVDIDRLKGSANVDVKFGKGLSIATLGSAKDVNIKAQFAKVNFDINDSDSFNFDITTKMGNGFDNSSGKAKITGKTPSDDERGYSSTKTYRGYVGKSGSDNKVTITTNFGEVNFN